MQGNTVKSSYINMICYISPYFSLSNDSILYHDHMSFIHCFYFSTSLIRISSAPSTHDFLVFSFLSVYSIFIYISDPYCFPYITKSLFSFSIQQHSILILPFLVFPDTFFKYLIPATFNFYVPMVACCKK